MHARAEKLMHPILHFTRSFICEREKQNVAGIDSVFEQVGHSICEGPRLSRTSASNNEQRPGRRSHRRELLFIQFRSVIDMDPAVGGCWRALQRVLTGHLVIVECPPRRVNFLRIVD